MVYTNAGGLNGTIYTVGTNIAYGSPVAITNMFTFNFWQNNVGDGTSTGSFPFWFGFGGSPRVYTYEYPANTYQMTLLSSVNQPAGGIHLPDNNWVMWTIVNTGTKAYIYTNGVVIGAWNGITCSPWPGGIYRLNLGAQPASGKDTGPWVNTLLGYSLTDELSVWSTNLNPAEITWLYNSGTPRSYSATKSSIP